LWEKMPRLGTGTSTEGESDRFDIETQKKRTPQEIGRPSEKRKVKTVREEKKTEILSLSVPELFAKGGP